MQEHDFVLSFTSDVLFDQHSVLPRWTIHQVFFFFCLTWKCIDSGNSRTEFKASLSHLANKIGSHGIGGGCMAQNHSRVVAK
ncbi:hypothetical protein ACLKA7_013744 [Drosophila subpalustris]